MSRFEKMAHKVFVALIAVTSILIFVNYCKCEDNSNCETFIRSTCTDNVTTDWNTHRIGENLKRLPMERKILKNNI